MYECLYCPLNSILATRIIQGSLLHPGLGREGLGADVGSVSRFLMPEALKPTY